MLEKTLESPLDYKEIKPVNPKVNQSWLLKGLMWKLMLQYFGHLMGTADSLEKNLMLGNIESEEKGTTWDKMVGHEFEQTPGDSEGQGSWHAVVDGVSKSQT